MDVTKRSVARFRGTATCLKWMVGLELEQRTEPAFDRADRPRGQPAPSAAEAFGRDGSDVLGLHEAAGSQATVRRIDGDVERDACIPRGQRQNDDQSRRAMIELVCRDNDCGPAPPLLASARRAEIDVPDLTA